jgi:hypothetical protein
MCVTSQSCRGRSRRGKPRPHRATASGDRAVRLGSVNPRTWHGTWKYRSATCFSPAGVQSGSGGLEPGIQSGSGSSSGAPLGTMARTVTRGPWAVTRRPNGGASRRTRRGAREGARERAAILLPGPRVAGPDHNDRPEQPLADGSPRGSGHRGAAAGTGVGAGDCGSPRTRAELAPQDAQAAGCAGCRSGGGVRLDQPE